MKMQFERMRLQRPTILPILSVRSFLLISSIPKGSGYALGKSTDAQLPPTILNSLMEDQSS
jgi:hypothetical protein